MQTGSGLTLQTFISAILISVAIASRNYRDSEWSSQDSVEIVPENNAVNEYPSRLVTAIPMTNRKRPVVASPAEEPTGQKKIIVSVPIESAASLIPRASNLSQEQLTDKAVSSKPQLIPLELTFNREPSPHSNNTSETVKKETNDTHGDDKAVPSKARLVHLELTFNREPSPRSNNTSETVKRETNNTHGETTKTEKVVTKPAAALPTHPPEVAQNSSTASNNSTPENSQQSQLLLSVQTVQGPFVPSTNVTDFGNLNNRSSNGSAVLISNTREIEVVIIAEKPPDPAPPETTTVFQPLPAIPASGHRFRSSLVFRNDSLLGAQRPLPTQYAPRHYWAVYLTLALLILSVLAICVLCCSSQGRRDMSLPAPKPLQYGHELPPYSYAFSYDMRQADSQEAARLNPTVP